MREKTEATETTVPLDPPHGQRLGRAHLARGVRELADERVVSDDLGQPLEGSDVCGKADVHLLDAEPGVGGAEPDVASRDELLSSSGGGVGRGRGESDLRWGRARWSRALQSAAEQTS